MPAPHRGPLLSTPQHEHPGFAFAGPIPDRAAHLREEAAALAAHWPAAGVLLVDADGGAVFDARSDALWLPSGAVLDPVLRERACFLGEHAGRAWFALSAEAVDGAPSERLDLRSAAARLDGFQAGLFAYARALLHWQSRSRYCGACGGALTLIRAGHAARCLGCGSEHYPRTDAAVIVAVSDGERLLLGRQANWPEKRWSVIAGFLEPGERLEDAVAREVMEETGIRVRRAAYVASQPWPFPSALMVGFRAEAEPDAPRVGEELQEARWFSAAELRRAVAAGEMGLSPRISIARRLIDDWLAERP